MKRVAFDPREATGVVTEMAPDARWNAVSLRSSHIGPGEAPEGCLLSHVLFLRTSAGGRADICLSNRHWLQISEHMPLLFIPAHIPYAIRWQDPVDCVAVSLEPEFVSAVRRPEVISKIDLGGLWPTDDPFLLQIIQAFHEEQKTGCLGGSLYGEHIGAALAAYLLRKRATSPEPERQLRGGLGRPVLQRMLEYMDSNLDRDLSLRSLAPMAGCGIDRFIRLFKQSTGVPPYQFLLRKRIERAQVLLATSELPMGEIAFRTGFADQSHFGRVFRRITGASPREYRRAVRS